MNGLKKIIRINRNLYTSLNYCTLIAWAMKKPPRLLGSHFKTPQWTPTISPELASLIETSIPVSPSIFVSLLTLP
ncbi:MAG: hypothetical protein AAB261_01595 [Chloroflexota bacterium]